jgi:hypothetical protein
VRGAVRIVLQALDGSGNAILVALEIHHAVILLVSTTHMADSNMAVVVAAGGSVFLFHQRGMRLALMQVGVDHAHHGAPSGGCWFKFDQCHNVTLARLRQN